MSKISVELTQEDILSRVEISGENIISKACNIIPKYIHYENN